MSTHKQIDRVCAAGLAVCLVLTALLLGAGAAGLLGTPDAVGYEERLFDTARVHTIALVMDDWEGFLDTCENEAYTPCSAVIDGEAYRNIGIRAKGNTSLSTVSSLGSDRYSFKLEFDQYDSGKSYHGLDKLCLNNIIQDNTYMKDYLTYQLMAQFGVAAPLCSFVYITVNGQDWGLYLAVEGVEDGFLRRNYGSRPGALYKPDSLSMGGGPGFGRDFDPAAALGGESRDFSPPSGVPEGQARPGGGGGGPDREGGPGSGGMGSADVKLQYIDDDPDSYAGIFDSAKTELTQADRARLIQALKQLEEDPASALDMDQVLRYFVVHNYVCNGDSYTGSMVHNYYLYEKDGALAMIPWDYNLAFGTFQARDAGEAVNDPIDSPLSVTGSGDRPMIDWIFQSEGYTQLYHQYFAQFLDQADPQGTIQEALELIAPYVERDPTKFCTYEDFLAGVETLGAFCTLRTESVAGQLAGTIPSTSQGQAAEPDTLVDASALTLSRMGTMTMGREGGGFPGGGFQDGGFQDGGPGGQRPDGEQPGDVQSGDEMPPAGDAVEAMAPAGMEPPEGGPGGDRTRGDFPGGDPAPSAASTAAPVSLALCVLVLLGGLGFALRYRRR